MPAAGDGTLPDSGTLRVANTVKGWPDRLVGALAATQRGLVTRAQLVALGISLDAIDHAVRRGRLQMVYRGVYVPISALPPLAQE